MSRVVALGERKRLEGFALAGVALVPAEDPQQLQAAWSHLAPDVAVVIFTPEARSALRDVLDLRPDVIWTTLPD
jgi:vacuolar-type H+-ATPase subunit F/Vma7